MWNKQRIENTIWHLCGYDCNAVWRVMAWHRDMSEMRCTHVQRPTTQRGNCYITRSRRSIAPFPNGEHAGRYHPRWLALRTGGDKLQQIAWTIGHEDLSQAAKNAMLSTPRLLWFCFLTLCDWLTKLAPLSRPMRSKSKTNRDLFTRVFPCSTPVTRICFEYWLVYCAVSACCDWSKLLH